MLFVRREVPGVKDAFVEDTVTTYGDYVVRIEGVGGRTLGCIMNLHRNKAKGVAFKPYPTADAIHFPLVPVLDKSLEDVCSMMHDFVIDAIQQSRHNTVAKRRRRPKKSGAHTYNNNRMARRRNKLAPSR